MRSYKDTVVLAYPDWFESKHKIRTAIIDKEIAKEIKGLWNKGVQTVASCSGHNTMLGIISVLPKYVEKMKELGYKNYGGWTLNLEEPELHFKAKST